jgi:hypothetical protein
VQKKTWRLNDALVINSLQSKWEWPLHSQTHTVCFLSSVGTVQQGSPYEFSVKLLMKTACKITTISMPTKKDNLHIMSICLEGLRVSLRSMKNMFWNF